MSSSMNYLYGLHAVQAVLEKEPETISALWLEHARRDARAQTLMTLARNAGIEIKKVKREELDSLVGEVRHQGVVAAATMVAARDEAWLKTFLSSLQDPPFLLVLDGVTDPHNLGACLRTADAAGVHAVIAPRDKACGLTGTVRKVACGAAETVPFVQVTNLARNLRMLQKLGIWLTGADAESSQDIYATDLCGPLALVMGAEGRGLRRLTQEHCDQLIRLPMRGSVPSLNVSVSTGICLYEALRQRNQK
ncbi:23S rRNA (guanosine(2251)-2'-O)-methyltransferase [hydrothermal vent metagenome]|uniref:23S rRNA (Guanosine(2251)-2'-O)-methyltransferase n=1 Tax=hydrothermal vent metagenome TaxID=652676 RepID=A0A3B1C6D3_9ZZZZ